MCQPGLPFIFTFTSSSLSSKISTFSFCKLELLNFSFFGIKNISCQKFGQSDSFHDFHKTKSETLSFSYSSLSTLAQAFRLALSRFASSQ
jgi:hypothetical protein